VTVTLTGVGVGRTSHRLGDLYEKGFRDEQGSGDGRSVPEGSRDVPCRRKTEKPYVQAIRKNHELLVFFLVSGDASFIKKIRRAHLFAFYQKRPDTRVILLSGVMRLRGGYREGFAWWATISATVPLSLHWIVRGRSQVNSDSKTSAEEGKGSLLALCGSIRCDCYASCCLVPVNPKRHGALLVFLLLPERRKLLVKT